MSGPVARREQGQSLNTRVGLHNIIQRGICIPAGAGRVDEVHVLEGGDLGLPLDELHGESLRLVPGDVAVHEPGL